MAVVLAVIALINTTWQILRAWLPKFLQEGRGYAEVDALYFNSVWFAITDVGCLGAGALAAKSREVARALRADGVTFRVAADAEDSGERVWPFDVIPRIVPAPEWARIEAGWHYPSDTLFSMALGNFIASFVNDAFLGLQNDESGATVSASVVRDGAVVHWSWRF